MTADNATSNDTQRKDLTAMDNSFEEEHHVRCFNHTLQLSAKALMRPFNPALGKAPDIDFNGGQDDLGVEDEDNEGDHNDVEEVIYDVDDDDDNELDDLDPYSRKELIEDVAVVRTTISKLCQLSFLIIWSTTVALPEWHHYCTELCLKPHNFPRDVVT